LRKRVLPWGFEPQSSA